MAKFSIVLPVHNESANLLPLWDRLCDSLGHTIVDTEFLFIDDGSTDDSRSMMLAIAQKNKSVKTIFFTRNFGHQRAILAGITHATGDYIITMDTDLQDPPELIPALIDSIGEGYEVVHATRRYNQPDGIFKRYAANMFYFFYNKITEVPIPHASGDFRIFSRLVANHILAMSDSHYFIRGQIAWLGFKQKSIYFERMKRADGEVSYTTFRSVKLAIDAIINFSNFPLRVVSFLGIITAFFSGALILITLLKIYILKYEMVQGWSSILLSVLFIGGVQMIAIGIIGEYLIRINDRIKNRPNFIEEIEK